MSFSQKLFHSAIFKTTNTASCAATATSDGNTNHTKTVVRNGNEVFFAHGSLVRYIDLSKDSSYKVLDVESVDFEVEGITINDSGTLLAVYNKFKLVVISLSLSSFSCSKTELIQCKSFLIGEKIYGEGTEIIEVLWNGVSRFDSTLIILSSDGVIRTFDLRNSVNEPDAIFQIGSYNKNRIGLTSNSIDSPVSMCLGSKGDLSGALTLYILNKDGDVFTIYPFMPKQIAIPREFIENLFNETLMLANTMSTSGRRSEASQQLRFVTALWNQLPTSQKEIRGDMELCVLENERYEEFFIQGPLAIQPFPSGLYDDYGINISRMDFKYSSILLISYLKSGILAVHPDTNQFMKWESSEVAGDYLMVDEGGMEDYPVLSVLELIDFGTGLPSYISPFNGESMAFIQSSNAIFKVDFSRWEQFLDNSIEKGEVENISGEMDSSLGAKVESCLKLQSEEGLEGIVGVVNEVGDREIIIVTTESTKMAFVRPAEKTGVNQTTNDKVHMVNDESLLTGPYSEISKLLKSVSNININSPSNRGGAISPDDLFLKELNGASTQALKYIADFHRLGLFLNSRLILEKKELKRQLEKTHDLAELMKKVNESCVNNKEATSSITARQEKINKRLENLSAAFKGFVDLPLSTKEKAWFKEVKDLTLSFNKSVKQNNELKNQLSFIRSEIQTKASAQSTDVYDDNQDWDQLEKVINEGKGLLENTSQVLKANFDQVDSHMKAHI